MNQSTYEGSHAFARMEAEAGEILDRYGSNHSTPSPRSRGDLEDWSAKHLDIDYDGFGTQRRCH